MEYVILNGEAIERKDANISVFSKGMFFNYAVYDSVKVVKGKSFFAEFHVDRLLFSAKTIGITHSFTKEDILEWVKILIKKNNLKDAMIRFLFQGPGAKDERPMLYLFSVGLTFYKTKEYRNGVKAVLYNGERLSPQAKSKDLLLNYMALRKAKSLGGQDALLVDHEGFVREGTRTNFFGVQDGKVYTAPLTYVLEGITRKLVVGLAKENDIEVVEESIHKDDLESFDEFFFTSTSMNILPITQIDEMIVRGGVGPVTKRLMKLFKEYYHREVFGNLEKKRVDIKK